MEGNKMENQKKEIVVTQERKPSLFLAACLFLFALLLKLFTKIIAFVKKVWPYLKILFALGLWCLCAYWVYQLSKYLDHSRKEPPAVSPVVVPYKVPKLVPEMALALEAAWLQELQNRVKVLQTEKARVLVETERQKLKARVENLNLQLLELSQALLLQNTHNNALKQRNILLAEALIKLQEQVDKLKGLLLEQMSEKSNSFPLFVFELPLLAIEEALKNVGKVIGKTGAVTGEVLADIGRSLPELTPENALKLGGAVALATAIIANPSLLGAALL